MPDLQVTLAITYEGAFDQTVDEDQLRRCVERAVGSQFPSGEVELSLVFVDDTAIRGLNRQFRGVDAVTDVLSFPQEDAAAGAEFVVPGLGPRLLGDVVISVPRAIRQAEEFGHSIAREIAYLMVHGTLHLLGYDHETAAERQRMRELEEAALVDLPR